MGQRLKIQILGKVDQVTHHWHSRGCGNLGCAKRLEPKERSSMSQSDD